MSDPVPAGAEELALAVDRLINQVAHWTPSRWGAASAVPGRSRAELFHDLVQRLADLDADAEGQPRRPVPRLDNDLALPDQLAVVAADLLRASPGASAVATARGLVAELRTTL